MTTTRIKKISPDLAVAGQISRADLPALAQAGYKTLICNRPDGEGADQAGHLEIAEAAAAHGIRVHYLPVESGKVSDEQAAEFGQILETAEKPALAYCRSGMRSATLWALSQAPHLSLGQIIEAAAGAGYDLNGVVRRISHGGKTPVDTPDARYDIVIVGGGAAGIATASSLLARDSSLDIAILDPAPTHYYQPGWTLVGAGVFTARETARPMGSLIPRGVKWIQSAVAAFEPERNAIILDGCRVIAYNWLVVCPGLQLDWQGVEGLSETLGQNGVTSNYRFDLAPYTWRLTQDMVERGGGRAIFTQPPMPIKCAGAPQKAMYLAADWWQKQSTLANTDVQFFAASPTLFGVAHFVPALMEYVQRYGITLNFQHKLLRVDGESHSAWFERTDANGSVEIVRRDFDMLHAVPPQKAPDFIRVSPLVDEAGWVAVDPATLQHKQFSNIFALGDVAGTSNAKTAAAARKQAPVVACNLLAARAGKDCKARYLGYGACPLTVERGKVVLAEFGYGGVLQPSFPKWLINEEKASRMAWLLKERILPPVYWSAMLKGKEWLAKPVMQDQNP